MGLEAVLQQIRSESENAVSELEKRLLARIELIEVRQLQLHNRLREVEGFLRWKHRDRSKKGQDEGPIRAGARRAKIPPRPKVMRESGDGVDPPLGDRKWLLML
jgi:hypothetical protein